MARLVNLGVVAPQDITFVMMDGSELTVSGRVDVGTVLRIEDLRQRLLDVQIQAEDLSGTDDLKAISEIRTASRSILLELSDEVLDLLRVNHPELEELPLSVEEIGVFVAALMGELAGQAGVDPTKTPPAKPTGANRSARRASTRSNGSPSSSRPSGSRRTTGGE